MTSFVSSVAVAIGLRWPVVCVSRPRPPLTCVNLCSSLGVIGGGLCCACSCNLFRDVWTSLDRSTFWSVVRVR